MAGEVIDLASMGGAINGTYVDIASVAVNTEKARSARPQRRSVGRRHTIMARSANRRRPTMARRANRRRPKMGRNVNRLRKAGRSR